VSSAGENSAHQNGCVDRRNLDIQQRQAGLEVIEVIVKPVLGRHGIKVKLQRGQNTSADLLGGQILSAVSDAERSETKTSGRDAGGETRIYLAARKAIVGSIENLAGSRISLFVKIQTRLPLHLVKEGGGVRIESASARRRLSRPF
jgi:hypothetical protein